MYLRRQRMRLPTGSHSRGTGMKRLVSAAAAVVVVGTAGLVGYLGPGPLEASPPPKPIAPESLNVVVTRTCNSCHNDTRKVGNLSLKGFDVAQADKDPEVAEKVIEKLRTGMMPPPGRAKPGGDTLSQLVTTLERIV